LTQPVDIISCADCYAKTEIKKWLDDDFNGCRSILDDEKVGGPEKVSSPGVDRG